MRILAIDPGNNTSGFVLLDTSPPKSLDSSPKAENSSLKDRIPDLAPDVVVIENMQARGGAMPIGQETFDTARWVGRFQEAAENAGYVVHLVYRRETQVYICGSTRAKDANVRQALVELFDRPGRPAVGRKKDPGPLYGVSGHAWQALGAAVAFLYREIEQGGEYAAESRRLLLGTLARG